MGLTQRELASTVTVSLGALRDLEQGRTLRPRWGMVEDIAAALGMDQRERTELMRAWRDSSGAGAVVGPTRRQVAATASAAGIRVEVLGPLMAWHQGTPIRLGSPRQRAVLGLLALHPDTGLNRDAIIDALWGDEPPASAVTEVQGFISRLRKLLDSGRNRREDLLVTDGTSYRLRADRVRLDVAAFQQLTDRAGMAACGLQTRTACELYEQALGLWRGEVLANVGLLRDNPAVRAVACHRSEAVVRYADVAARTGSHDRVLPHLRELAAREPFNERAHAHLMISLAAAGQQAAALEIFDAMRRRLDHELGVRPCAPLIQAHLRVLRQQISR
jgi:DNA-binding SARP family transcriptional activator/DNA-binding XRE family transcriptional regulator